MTHRHRRVDLPFLEIADSAFSRAQQRLLFLDDDRLCSVPLEALKCLRSAKPHMINRDLDELVDECSLFSISSTALTGAYVDYDEFLHIVDLTDFSTTHCVEIENENDAISALSVSPDGDIIVYLEEIDRDDEALLLYQWKLVTADSGEPSPISIFGEADIKIPDLIGWWSNDVACFSAPGNLVFWHVPTNRTKMLAIPEPYRVVDSVFGEASPFACLTLEAEDRFVTCLVEVKDSNFTLTKLVNSYRCLDWEPQSEQLLVCSSAGNLRSIQLKSQVANDLCHVETEFDSAVFVASGLIFLLAEHSLGIVSH
jgi:WD40 repeat protein